jgi:hypothetical protein
MNLYLIFSADLEDALDLIFVCVGDDDEHGGKTGDQRLCIGATASDERDLFCFAEALDGGGDSFCGNGQCRTVGKELFDLFVSLASASENEDRSFFNVEVKRKIISHMKLHSTALAAKINFEI